MQNSHTFLATLLIVLPALTGCLTEREIAAAAQGSSALGGRTDDAANAGTASENTTLAPGVSGPVPGGPAEPNALSACAFGSMEPRPACLELCARQRECGQLSPDQDEPG